MKPLKFLLVTLLCHLSITGVFAQTSTAPAVGNGTSTNPYQVATLNNLYWLSQNSAQWVAGKYFIQTADIDASSTSTWFSNGSGGYYGFPCIGGNQTIGNQLSAVFYGNYDGQGYSISNLYINRPNDRIALFGNAQNAVIKNLSLVSATVIIPSTSAPYGVGILMGYSLGSTVDNVHITGGSITSNNVTGGFASAGPFVGWVESITISNCSTSASVTTNGGFAGGFTGIKGGGAASFTNCHTSGVVVSTGSSRIGGFLGQTDNSGTSTFTNCSATGNVTGVSLVGGFVGYFAATSATLNNCFARGNVTATGGTAAGFYAYTNSTTVNLNNCYSTGAVTGSTKGGFGTQAGGTITHTNCFWDTQTSGLANALPASTPSGITGKTTAQMKTESTFTGAGWDFITETTNGTNDYWFIDVAANAGYPSLASNIREWTGATSNVWSDAANWKNAILPTSTSIIQIQSGAPNLPAVSADITLSKFNFNGVNHILDLGNYNLTCSQVLAFDANKYIKTSGTGVLKMNIANNRLLIFPVGNTAYNPVTIGNTSGGADDFSARVLDEVYLNGTSGAASTATRVQRTWDISKTTSNGGTGINFIFNWNGGETSGSMVTPTLYHYASGWHKQTGTTSSTSTSLTYTGYTGTFSPFAVAEGASTLPVNWLSFTAREQNKTIILDWSTTNEKETENYLVQHSTNSTDWNTIGTKAAAGNSNTILYYTFIHNIPVNGYNYYRLIQRDIDGKESFSKVVYINLAAARQQISVYPNPVVNGKTNIRLEKATTIQVYNSAGAIVMRKNLQAGTQQLELDQLPKGIYQIKAGDETISFIKQ